MTDELDLLRAWRPAEPADAPSASAATAEARARLEAHITAAGDARTGGRPPRRARRRWLIAAPAGLAAAAVAAALLLTQGSGDQYDAVAPSGSAARALDRAAGAAGRSPAAAPFPGPSDFFYIKSEVTTLVVAGVGAGRTVPALRSETAETWQSPTRPGRRRVLSQSVRWPSTRARQAWIMARRPALASTVRPSPPPSRATFRIGDLRLTDREVRAFDDPPEVLYRRIRAEAARDSGPGAVDDVLFAEVGEALGDQAAPPRLRAALYRVLALMPDVESLGTVRDRLGRRAFGVARTETADGATTRRELLFDPRTSALLAEREVMVVVPAGLRGLLPADTTIGEAVYLRRATVDRVGQRP